MFGTNFILVNKVRKNAQNVITQMIITKRFQGGMVGSFLDVLEMLHLRTS